MAKKKEDRKKTIPPDKTGKENNQQLAEEKISYIFEKMSEGEPYKAIMNSFMEDYKLSGTQFRRYHKKALDRIKATFTEDILDIRSGVITDLIADIKKCKDQFVKYEEVGDVRAGTLAHAWFKQMLELKKEYIEYYPGVKPKEIPLDKDAPDVQFIEDDGIDDEIKQIEETDLDNELLNE